MKIYSVCCVGGANIQRQIHELRYAHNFVIGTPGRLKDLIERNMIKLNQFSTIVLDEADRMLDMGFIHDMRFVMAGMPSPRHTLFFSATMNPVIEGLIKEFLHEPVRISVKTGDTAKNVDQDVVNIRPGENKFDVLYDLLKQKELSKVLIFGRTKHGVEKLSKILAQRGLRAESIHGNKNHTKRQKARLYLRRKC
jgi:superfamily II DNA/RNA helicase